MNKRIFKRIMSLVIIVVMAVSTMMVSAVSTSAETANVTYKFDFQTAGSLGKSNDMISIKVNGKNGSTEWKNVKFVANAKKDSCYFSDIDVGEIRSITVKNIGIDGWYPEIINITVDGKTTTIYGGRWVDDGKEVTLAVTDRVAKVNVQTGPEDLSGTDCNVFMQLIDEKGDSTYEINLSSIHPNDNAFEAGDRSTFYIKVPDNFNELSKIDVVLDRESDYWNLYFVDATLDGKIKIFPCNEAVIDDVVSVLPSDDILLYRVSVKTGDVTYAGTDNDVYLYTYDEKGNPINHKEFPGGKSSNRYLLDSDGNDFEKGDLDVFYILSSKKICNIKSKMAKGSGTDWNLNYIQLDLMDGDTVVESVKYKFNQWMDFRNDVNPKSKEVLL